MSGKNEKEMVRKDEYDTKARQNLDKADLRNREGEVKQGKTNSKLD